MKTRQNWVILTILPMLLSCDPLPGPTGGVPTTYNAQLLPPQVFIPPAGQKWGMNASVTRQPDNLIVDLKTWPTGTYRWEILGVPSGVDGGHFQFPESGKLSDASFPPLDGTKLYQWYLPPATLPTGTTRLELKIRVTITPPDSLNGGPVAQAEIPLILDVTAPPVAPKDEGTAGSN